MTDDDRDRTLRIILARCPELSERDIVGLLAESGDEMIPGRIVMQVMEVLDRMSERLAVYEAKFADPEPVVVPSRLH
jgi:hypothetical protein